MTLKHEDFALIDTTPPVTLKSKPVKGSYQFIFEFKLREGTLYFIRYRQGERDLASKNLIPVWLYSTPEDIIRAIRQHLASYSGVTERVVKSAIDLCIS